MMYLFRMIQKFPREEEGQALTEYGLIIALVAVVLVGALLAMSGALETIFEGITTELESAPTSGS